MIIKNHRILQNLSLSNTNLFRRVKTKIPRILANSSRRKIPPSHSVILETAFKPHKLEERIFRPNLIESYKKII